MARKFTKRRSSKILKIEPSGDRTALYIRVSTDRQAEEGFSLDVQRDKLELQCQVKGWDVLPEDIYVDAGMSGKSIDRPAYRRMIAEAESGSIRRIVTTKLDRLSRNTSDFLNLVDYMHQIGCALVILDLDIDTGTHTGLLVATVLAGIATWERKQITERVMSGKKEKANQGGYNGSRIPLGYSKQKGAEFVINEDAQTVRGIFYMFNGGWSLTAIVVALNASGARTSRGGHWHAATVRYILSNGFYAGLSQWSNEGDQPGDHDAIITIEDYQAAQRRLDAMKPGPSPVDDVPQGSPLPEN